MWDSTARFEEEAKNAMHERRLRGESRIKCNQLERQLEASSQTLTSIVKLVKDPSAKPDFIPAEFYPAFQLIQKAAKDYNTMHDRIQTLAKET